MTAKTEPSILEILYLVLARIITRTVTPIISHTSENIFESTVKGLMAAEVPKMKKMLKILLPMIFPRAMSTCFFKAAVTEVTSSGSEVPTATIVKPTKVSLIPSARAISILLSTTRVPPNTMPASPPIVKSEFFNLDMFAESTGFSSVFRRSFLATSKI